jgi:hypothetical protein
MRVGYTALSTLGLLSKLAAGNPARSICVGLATDQQEGCMDRIKILDETLWPQVPKDVITEAEHAAKETPVWIAQQSNGHIVAMDGPGDPEVATGDIVFIAEVAPSAGS